jgi:RNA polymerase sigma-70 factor, ECF subfamily
MQCHVRMPRPLASAVVTATAIPGHEPEALLTQAAAGECAALIQIYDHFAPQVLGVIRRVLADVATSELALEDVFVKLWREAPQLVRARVSVRAWLILAARAHAVDRLRRSDGAPPSSTPKHAAASLLDDSPSWMPDAQAIGRLDERRALLRKVLGQLPRAQLKSLELMVFGGRAEAELAGDLCEPLARVKSEVRAAARFLRHRRRAVVGSWTVDI